MPVSAVADGFLVVTQNSDVETAGTAFSVTVTAWDSVAVAIDAAYTGPHTILFTSTATAAPDLTDPTIPVSEVINFVAGVGTSTVAFTLTNAGETPTITATEAAIVGTSASITVNPVASKLVYTVVPGPTTPSVETGVFTVQRQDQYDNPVTTGALIVGLATTSDGLDAEFRYPTGVAITFVTILDTQSTADFYYCDDKVGTWTLTASVAGITSAVTDLSVEGVEIDSEYYRTGDLVIATVCDLSANVRPLVVETVTITASSDYPDLITVTLTETGLATGIFTGSFTLVGAAPGPTDLLVEDGSTVSVVYGLLPTLTADIDDSKPIITIVYPLDGEIISNPSPIISADADDDALGSGLATANMKLDGVLVDTAGPGPVTLSYEVPVFPEEMKLSEGIHTVSVTAMDYVGNTEIKTWVFNVDLTEPTVVVDVSPDPVGPKTGIAPDEGLVTFTLTFNEKMDTGIPPTVTFGLTAPYNTYSVSAGSWDLVGEQVWTGTFTVQGTTVEGLNTISVSIAEDVSGKVMDVDTTNTFMIDTGSPSAPTDLVATVTDVSVTLDWTESTDVDGTGVKGYLIMCGITELATVAHPTTTYTDYSLTVAGAYTYTVTAVDFADNEAVSAGVPIDFVPGDVIAREIALLEDWNLISLPMIPEDSSIEVVLADVMVNVEVVWSYDEGNWYRYLPGLPGFSTLWDMEDGKGYWVKMAGEDSLIAYGTELPEPPALPPVYHVYEEWNIIGFKSIESMEINEYFTTIPSTTLETAVCYRYDASAQAYELVYLGGVPLEIEPGVDFEFVPGQGYWLYLVDEANIAPP